MSLSTANKIQRPSGTILIANVKLKLALVIYILYIFLVILPRSVQTKIKQKIQANSSPVYLQLNKNRAVHSSRSNLATLRLKSWSLMNKLFQKKLNKLNISKSPGPDGIHPRVLFELRYELLEPLNILFESSYKLGKLPVEWKLGHVTAVYKKGNKGDPVTDQLV